MRLIDAEELERLFYEQVESGATDLFGAFEDALQDAQTVDAVPVVHGRWEYNAQTIHTQSLMRCSICGWWTLDPSVYGAYHYCPNCGAKMDLEEEHGQGLRLKR